MHTKSGAVKVEHRRWLRWGRHCAACLNLVLLAECVSVLQPREEMVFSGKYKTGEQILRLANERFAVPEMLFHPADIGIQEKGIPEAIVDSVESLPAGGVVQ